MKIRFGGGWLLLVSLSALSQQPTVVYECPGSVFTNTITANDAQSRGCKVKQVVPTTIPGLRPKTAASQPMTPASGPARNADSKVEPSAQKQRDSDARRILDAELRREEDKLAALRREFNGGEPERRGDERNYQRYLDRVSEIKAGILRSESDVAALKRELGKLPP